MDHIDSPDGTRSHSQNPIGCLPSHASQSLGPIHFDSSRIVKHILVIGFHHKHGYQVDYCYPPLVPGGPILTTPSAPISLPSCWRTLPLLCLPDGSHNYTSDTIYFTMPDCDIEKDHGSNIMRTDGIKTIFGTACYRQIQADKLLNRTDDMTRLTVQKSVCVLSTKPLFGLIRSKLEMITHAYFEELDFSKVKILKLTYDNLNSLLSRDTVKENGLFLGLSTRRLVSQFGCNVLVLYKAILLEKKILFYKSPVRDLCSTILAICSLFPGLLECGGLDYSTCDLQLSPPLLDALKLPPPPTGDSTVISSNEIGVLFTPSKEQVVIMRNKKDPEPDTSIDLQKSQSDSKQSSGPAEEIDQKPDESDFEIISESVGDISSAEDFIIDDSHALKLIRMEPETCNLPLKIFTRGSFCLPYLSISYLDLLADSRVKSFVIGATNFLFKQKRDLYDIIVDMDEDTITINDSSLKKCLSLSTEDLRFMDYLCRNVKVDRSLPKDEFDLMSQDITKWVGGDEWIRHNFKLYTLYLLKASKNLTSFESFNANFIRLWKTTNNYLSWDKSSNQSLFEALQNKHPFASTTKGINFNDMKLKLSYAVSNSEKGRAINQSLNGIGKWSIWTNIASAASSVAASSSMALSSLSSKQTNTVDGGDK